MAYSIDGLTWTTATNHNDDWSSNIQTITLVSGITAKFWRLIQSADTNGYKNGSAWFIDSFSMVGTSGGTDLYATNVSLLLTGNGTNGSTAITDLSASPKSITSSATIDTTTKKYGTGSIRTSPTGSKYALITNTTAMDLSGDFTIECWAYMVSQQSYGGIFSLGVAGNASSYGPFVLTVNSTSITTYISTSTAITSSVAMSLNAWTHLAVTMKGTTYTLWVNGVNTASTTYAGARGIPYTTSTLGLWYSGTDNYYFDGNIDDFRITKGIARYTANFTPPTTPLTL